ncbi:MAG TPA: peptide deformylase, partial [Thermodesulfobacteriota bacterium]|nr:peptide deformylase [Thermodesulfobacteriota bacterium]
MSILNIIKYPDPILKKKSEPVREITPEIQRFIDDMAETMYAAPGVGLAAPQVGRSIRVIVIDVNSKEEQKKDLISLINPEIIERSGDIAWEEGCLSIPDYSADVKRAERVVVRGLDRDGKEKVIVGEELLSIVLQHEIDHLDGMLFIDRLGPIKRDLVKRRLRKQARVD